MQAASEAKLGWHHIVYVGILAGLALGSGLGSATRLTYHEAFVAQGAREILTSGHWWYPEIGGLPWLEKPPLPFWLVAGLGWCMGDVSPLAARIPSAIAAAIMVLGVILLVSRRFGAAIGILSGAIQATTAWTVLRGRLAEADILLACLFVWTLLAFDRLRQRPNVNGPSEDMYGRTPRAHGWRWGLFVLLGVTTLVKGTGFGAVLLLSVVGSVLLWDRDRVTWKRLWFPAGLLLVALMALSWPLAMIATHGFKVVSLWILHVTERVAHGANHGPFAGESWSAYGLAILGQALPWTPLAAIGAWGSLKGALRGYHGDRSLQLSSGSEVDQVAGHRLLWAWAIAPLALVSLASARRSHYAIYALVPWSVWAAFGLTHLGARWIQRGWAPERLRRLTWTLFGGLAAAYGLGFWLAGSWFNHRGEEWAFYEAVGRRLPATTSVILLYDDWDRDPYPTPFGPIPHDLAVRLYYLNRPACWHFDARGLESQDTATCPLKLQHDSSATLAIIGRDRDLPTLQKFGPVEVLARSSPTRWDRTYILAQFQPREEVTTDGIVQSSVGTPIRR